MKTLIIKAFVLSSFLLVMNFTLFAQTLEVGTVQGTQEVNVTVPVTLYSMPSLGSVSLVIEYDSDFLSFVGATNVSGNPSINPSTSATGSNPVIIAWFDITGAGQSFPDGTPWINLEFTYFDCTSDLTIDQVQSELLDFEGYIVSTSWVNGLVAPMYPGAESTSWSGSQSQDWSDPLNWSDGVPGCNSDVVISDVGGNFPVIGDSKFLAVVNSLTIQSFGALTILGNLYVTNDLVMEPNASIIESGNVTVGGTTNFKINGVNAFHLLSPPLDYAQAFPFLGNYLRTWNEATQVWQNITAPSTVLTTGTGYSLETTSAPQIFTFSSGNLNYGDLTTSGLSYTSGPNPLLNGFHLLGNHFPSSVVFNPINWALINMDPTAWVWDQVFGNYRVTGVSLAGDVIPPAQGFFVRVLSAPNGSLTVPQSDRVHNVIPFFKSETDNKLYLTVMGNSYGDQIAITLNDEATSGFDLGLDALKLGGLEEAPQMYSVIDGDIQVSGNVLPYMPSVGFNLEVGADGEYTITAEGMGSFASNVTIVLEDLLTGTMTDLKENDTYTFTASTGDDAERFILHFGTLGIETNLADNINVYAYNGAIHVNMPVNTKGQVYIYNVMGQEIVSEYVDGNNSFYVKPGAGYIVKVVAESSVKTEKVIVQ